MSKGFRQQKTPSKADIAKAASNANDRVAAQEQVFKMMLQQFLKLSQEVQHQSRELEALANLVATGSISDKAKEGDVVIVNSMGLMKDTMLPFEGGTANRTAVRLGSKSLIAGFEEALIGAEIAQELDIPLTFPQEYHAKDLAGKEVIFKVIVLDILRNKVDTTNFDSMVKEAHERGMKEKTQNAKPESETLNVQTQE